MGSSPKLETRKIMNRRGMFSKLFSGLALASTKVNPLDAIATPIYGESVLMRTAEPISMAISEEHMRQIASIAVSRVKFFLPNGCFSVIPDLTEVDKFDTIWTAGSSG